MGSFLEYHQCPSGSRDDFEALCEYTVDIDNCTVMGFR